MEEQNWCMCSYPEQDGQGHCINCGGKPLPSWLSIREAAQKYGLKSDTLYNAVRNQVIPARRSGKMYLVDEHSPTFQSYVHGLPRGRRRVL